MAFLNLNKQELDFLEKRLMFLKLQATVGEDKYLDRIIKRIQRVKKPIKIQSRKAKGRSFQKQIADDIANLLNIKYDQQDDNCLIHSREMGQSGTDIVLRNEAQTQFPFSIEVKNQNYISLLQFINQAKYNKKDNTDWMIVIKSIKLNKPIVVLEWEAFLKYIKDLRK